MRTSIASFSGESTVAGPIGVGAGCGARPATLNTAFARIGFPGVTAGNPATSTTVPGLTAVACSVSMRAPPVPSLT